MKMDSNITIRQALEDIRIAAEAALQVSETRYRRLFEAAQDGILILDAVSGQIVDVNPFLVAMLGYPQAELVGKQLWEIGAFKDIQASKVAFAELQSTGYVRYESLPLETCAGEHINVEFVSNVYQVDRQSVIQCNIRDITARKRVEQEVEQLRQDLEQRNAELTALDEQKDHFLSVATHDLRSPLTVIYGFSELLFKGTMGPLNEKQTQSVAAIRVSSEFMLRLVEDLLDIAKITSGKVRLDLQPLDLVALAQRSIALNNILAYGKQIEITLCESEALPDIMADAFKLEQVLNNLFSNAIKFSYPQSAVEVRIARDGDTVTLAVKDQGQGIPATELAQLFTPFAKTSVQSTAGERSTGLGLAITKQVILEHQGNIWVESQVGQGTTFYVSLPIARNP